MKDVTWALVFFIVYWLIGALGVGSLIERYILDTAGLFAVAFSFFLSGYAFSFVYNKKKEERK